MAEIISNIITGTGVLVTGVLTYFVWQATVATNKIAESSLELNKSMIQEEKAARERYRKVMRKRLLPLILENSSQIYEVIKDPDYRIIQKRFIENDYSLGVSAEEVAEFFNDEESDRIISAWNEYEIYRRKHFSPVFHGNDGEALIKNAPPVIEKFEKLLEWFK